MTIPEQLDTPRPALARLRSCEPVFGAMQTIPVPTLTELAIWSGFDFVTLDCEHGVVDEPGHFASLQVLSSSEAFAVVRVRRGDLAAVGRYLEFGADGILMPDVRTSAEAEAFVAAATHGPNGTRSSTGSGGRATQYGLAGKADREPPLLMAMIEGAAAVGNIESIVATPGLDGCVIGPHDLAADLGCPNDFSTAAYTEAFVRIEKTVTGAGLLIGSAPHPGFPIERLLDGRHCFIQASSDVSALLAGYHTSMVEARRALGRWTSIALMSSWRNA